MYKAIFLDIDDTVFNFEKCSRFALKSSCEICHIPYQEKEFAIFQAIDNNLWSLQKKGELSVADVLRIRAEQAHPKIRTAENECNISKSVFGKALRTNGNGTICKGSSGSSEPNRKDLCCF